MKAICTDCIYSEEQEYFDRELGIIAVRWVCSWKKRGTSSPKRIVYERKVVNCRDYHDNYESVRNMKKQD